MIKKQNFWFRICFEREFDDMSDAQEYLDNITDEIYNEDVKKLSQEIEEKQQ